MKGKNIKGFLSLLFIVGLAAVLAACNTECFAGSRQAETGTYRLDADYMTGTDSLTMEIKAGDALAVHFETVRGSICLEIKGPDNTSLYAGNGRGVTDFSLNISESGTYSIYVEARRAKGTVHIQRVDGKRTQSD